MVNLRVNGEILEQVGLVVFDKDGTLLDLYAYWGKMVEWRAEKICALCGLDLAGHKADLMDRMGVDLAQARLKPEGPVGIFPREVVQKAAEDYIRAQGCTDAGQICFTAFKDVDERSLRHFQELVVPIAGAIDLLKALKARGCRLAIATTDKAARAKAAFDFLEIAGLFDVIVGADMVKASKPAPDMLVSITAVTGVPAARSVMVGDAPTDVAMGVNAGCLASVGVCSGLTQEKDLLALTRYVVRDVADIVLI